MLVPLSFHGRGRRAQSCWLWCGRWDHCSGTTGPPPSVLPLAFPHQEESCAPGSSPAALGFSFLCTLPPGVLASHSCRPRSGPCLGVCALPAGWAAAAAVSGLWPTLGQGWLGKPFLCIPQVGGVEKGAPAPVSPRLGVLCSQHHLSLAGGGGGSEHGIWAGFRPRVQEDGWEPTPGPGTLSST